MIASGKGDRGSTGAAEGGWQGEARGEGGGEGGGGEEEEEEKKEEEEEEGEKNRSKPPRVTNYGTFCGSLSARGRRGG